MDKKSLEEIQLIDNGHGHHQQTVEYIINDDLEYGKVISFCRNPSNQKTIRHPEEE